MQKLTFSLTEAATICLFRSPQRLRDWVARGQVVPVASGTKGRGLEHKFSSQQLLGLATVGGLIYSKRGCSREWAKVIIDIWAKMSESALDEHLSGYERELEGVLSDYGKESLTSWKMVMLQDLGYPTPLDHDDKVARDIRDRLDRVARAIIAKRAGEPFREASGVLISKDRFHRATRSLPKTLRGK